MLDQVEKVAVRAPFKRIDPITIRSGRPSAFAEKLLNFEVAPSLPKLAGLMWSAIAGQ